MTDSKPTLLVTVFSDFICPFCYVGHVRLNRLRDLYELKVNWRFLEIHPETPPEGRPVGELNYPAPQWRQMMDNLEAMAREEGLSLAPREFVANSHKALLLAEAAKEAGAECFYRLSEALFQAYFRDGRNIGDPAILAEIAVDCAVPPDLVIEAWREPRFAQRLADNLALARRYRITGTPTFVFGDRVIAGAVPYSSLVEAAANVRHTAAIA
jgi:predicted DsbA family dithiol-disulfide isomerase